MTFSKLNNINKNNFTKQLTGCSNSTASSSTHESELGAYNYTKINEYKLGKQLG